jgi:hypothetical protein
MRFREAKMLSRIFQLLLVACLVTGTLWAAIDPFAGDWKLNPSKSMLIDRMRVESLGGAKYEFDFGGGPERIVVDGTDQSGVSGTMLSVTVERPDTWKVVRKKDGRMLLTATWKLSQDGKTLSDNYTEFGPNGSPSTVNYLYQRTPAGHGFVGSWERPVELGKELGNSTLVLQIRPYEENGLSFIRSTEDVTRNVKFDGKDYPNVGHGVVQGSTSSARRVAERTLEITDKINGKISRIEMVELSPDLKTLTRTVRPVGQHEPNIFVFERQ